MREKGRYTRGGALELKRVCAGGTEYILWRVAERDDFVIAAEGEDGFYCGSLFGGEEDALYLFDEIAESETPPYAIFDIIGDSRQKLYFTNQKKYDKLIT